MARSLAFVAHKGQTRRDGKTPYFRHVVATEAFARAILSQASTSQVCRRNEAVIRAAAFLHDVIENTEESVPTLLLKGVHPKIVAVVELLTHDKAMSYVDYVRMAAQNPLASIVKLADIFSNLSDIPTPRQIKKYAKALEILKGTNVLL